MSIYLVIARFVMQMIEYGMFSDGIDVAGYGKPAPHLPIILFL
jgi:hypothetical protein